MRPSLPLATLLLLFVSQAQAIPALARKFGLSCSSCHLHGARLNEFGLTYAIKGARGIGKDDRGGIPITVWASVAGGTAGPNQEKFRAFARRIEIIGLKPAETGSSGYGFQWWPLSMELDAAGRILNRSGRFEDAYVTSKFGRELQVQVGQFRPATQYDVTQRYSIQEPLVYRLPLPGDAASSTRRTALRSFAAGVRSPGLRIAYTGNGKDGVDGFYATAALLFPGEVSLPLGSAAERNASPEFDSAGKGVFMELYRRHGENAYGLNGFVGNANRRSIGAVVNQRLGESMNLDLAAARVEDRSGSRSVATVDWQFVPAWNQAYGVRLDAVEHGATALVPYLSIHTVERGGVITRNVLELRISAHSRPTIAFEINLLR